VSDAEDKRLPRRLSSTWAEAHGHALDVDRHGESYANANGLAAVPLGDGGLTPLGAARLRPSRSLDSSNELSSATAFYTSPCARDSDRRDTERGTPEDLEAVVDAALNEISVGEGDGLPGRVVERYGSPDWTSIPRP